MIRLYKRFAPTADFRRKEIIGRYTKLRDNKPDVYDIGLWLGKWEKVFADGVKAGLSDVEGKRPFEDFVCVASSVTPGFSEYWRNRLMDGIPDGMDFYSLIQRFREFQSQARFDTISHGVFTATLNGRDADGNSMDRKTSPCLCRENHRYSDCPYLCEAVRSPDWKPDLAIEQEITQALARSENLRETVNKARAYALRTRCIAPPSSRNVF